MTDLLTNAAGFAFGDRATAKRQNSQTADAQRPLRKDRE